MYLFIFLLSEVSVLSWDNLSQQRAVLDRGNKKKSGTVPSRYTKLDHKHFKTESVSQTNNSDDFTFHLILYRGTNVFTRSVQTVQS